MTRSRWLLTLIALVTPATLYAQAGWDSVAAILQTPAVPSPGYSRFNLPRADLTVRIGDVTVATALAAGAWAGFAGTPAEADVMGDLVLTAAELPAVQAALLRDGIDVMAVHNHLAGESPAIYYMHFHGHGAAVALAQRLARAIALTATPLPVAAGAPPPLVIDTARVFAALGVRGRARGAVAQVGPVLVADTVRMGGMTLVPALAYGSPINIQQVSPDRFVATGDFSVTAAAVPRVQRALSAAGITITAMHSHLVGETPTISYMHFWADGPPDRVLAGLAAALQAAR